MNLDEFIRQSLAEDIGPGDHSTKSCIPIEKTGSAKLLVKASGILAGVQLAKRVFELTDPETRFESMLEDGVKIEPGMVAFNVTGKVHTILACERVVLNCMQRMSGIASLTSKYVAKAAPYGATILDTRKTTPLNREMEKWAVRIGGGQNHRMGLYDMIMLKDNHIDFAGGIPEAIGKTITYLKTAGLDLNIEVETRNLNEVQQVLATGGIQRIMLDNFSPVQLKEAVALIGGKFETEASGGINLENIEDYARTGVNFISVGALTHSVAGLDLSLKADFK